MKQGVSQKNIILIFSLMILGVIARWIPSMPNFSPYIGVALFAGAMLPTRTTAILGTTMMLYAADFVINNTTSRQYFTDYEGIVWIAPYMLFNLIATIIMVIFGSYLLRKTTVANVGIGALTGAVVFFIISNFGVWMSQEIAYPKTFSGLMQCYTAGIPFFRGTMMSGLLYSAVLFGGYELISRAVGQQQVQEA